MLLLALFTLYHQVLFALNLMFDGDESDFKDLGKLLLGGFVLAVAAGIAFTVVRQRLRDKKPPAAQFISINSFKHK